MSMDTGQLGYFREYFGKTRVSCDIDGVILMSAIAVLNRLNSDLESKHTIKDITHWEAVRDIAFKEFRKRGLSQEEAQKQALEYDDWIWSDNEVMGSSPVADGAEAFLRRLYTEGIDYCFITSRIPALIGTTVSSFRKYFPWEDPSKIIMNTDVNLPGKEFKWRTIIEKGIGIHIDDSQDHAQLVVENTPAKVILLSYPSLQEQNYSHPRLFRLLHDRRQANLRDLHKAILSKGLNF